MAEHPDSIRNDVDSMTVSRVTMARTKDADLVLLMGAIATASKLVARSVRKAGIAGLYGSAGTENVTGDSQKKLDVLSNDMFVNALYNSQVCAVLVSEEDEEAILVPEDIAGRFCVAFDPLDGSSNIDCNVSTGTIFSVWEKAPDSGPPNVADILRPGREMVCAGKIATLMEMKEDVIYLHSLTGRLTNSFLLLLIYSIHILNITRILCVRKCY